MTGHAPSATVEAVRTQAGRGFTFMLPTEDAIWVGEELARRFGLPYWQFALTATDANRFAIRLAREITGRPEDPGLQLVLPRHRGRDLRDPARRPRRSRARGTSGRRWTRRSRPGWSSSTTSPRSRRRSRHGDVACVLAEPALTNVGIVHPEPGFHAALRELTRRAGTLLIIDETHTICAGPGGYTRAHGLEPDILTLGKPVGGGVPAAVYGLSAGRRRARAGAEPARDGGHRRHRRHARRPTRWPRRRCARRSSTC